ncbi:hypothetical protein NSERKGN1266_47610 [Nocardia seriolae]|nr:hypothetical protein NSERKGN1266_47610 [Nocardia seriolae]BEK96106.1 hypothetical protein NSER024013_40120 [Nocardia seriolae]
MHHGAHGDAAAEQLRGEMPSGGSVTPPGGTGDQYRLHASTVRVVTLWHRRFGQATPCSRAAAVRRDSGPWLWQAGRA